MNRLMILIGTTIFLVSAGTLAAQEADTTAPAEQAPAVEAPPAEMPSAEAPAVQAPPAAEAAAVEAQGEDAAMNGEEVADAEPEHDWEFTLSATDKAPGASGTVMVKDEDQGSGFVLVANGLPLIDALDEENRDVNAYTVWVVPGKDKVAESQFAGVLTVTPEGTGRLEAETDLDTFGLIVTATPDGAPEKIGGVPVLTGIPVQADAPPEAVEEADEAAENVAEEVDDVSAESDPAEIDEEEAEVSEEVSEGMEEVDEATAEAEAEAAEAAAEQAPDATP